jgi:hypothetical protein
MSAKGSTYVENYYATSFNMLTIKIHNLLNEVILVLVKLSLCQQKNRKISRKPCHLIRLKF